MQAFEFTVCMFAVVLGAVVGSFLNVCIWRLPRDGLSLNRPRRSHCPRCGTPLAWYDNLPVVGWIVLGGHCRSCHGPVSIRYVVVEALTATLFGVLAHRYLQADDLRWPEFFLLSTLVSGLIVASFIDMDLRVLPDEITVNGMLILPLVAVLVPDLHARDPNGIVWDALAGLQLRLQAAHLPEPGPVTGAGLALGAAVIGIVGGLYGYSAYWRLVHPRYPRPLRAGALAGVISGSTCLFVAIVVAEPRSVLGPRSISFVSALLGMATGATLVLLVGIVGSVVFRKPAMGFGDVKLMGLLGGFTGWSGVLAGFALACCLGSLVGIFRLLRYRTRYVWFGPFLALGCLLVILYPGALEAALNWYLGLFRG